jgi:phospholipid transport system substrate-binding protein
MGDMTTRPTFVRAFAILIALGGVAQAAQGPLQTLKTKNGEVDKLLRLKTEPNSPAEKKQKDEVKALAATLLDYSELGKRSMATNWDKLSAPQREQFNNTFRDLIEHHYVKQLKTNLDYTVQYKEEQIEGEEATVSTIVKVKTKGKSTDAEIVYKLRRTTVGWMVWDVITDEVSLVRNYRSQFNKIMTDKGFDELIKKMKTKIEKEES